jgi:hypothetical protein
MKKNRIKILAGEQALPRRRPHSQIWSALQDYMSVGLFLK